MAKKDCPFCDKHGLMILPLRYSVAVADDIGKELAAIPALPGHLGDGVKDLNLTHGKYVPAMLRAGYLYVLVERKKIKSWEGYFVTDEAYLYKFRVEMPPATKIEFTCDPTTCGIDASMISIDKASDVEKVYFLFTPSPLTPAKLKEYKADPDGLVAKKKMQVFDPKAWLAGNKQQPHALDAPAMRKHTVEWILLDRGSQAFWSLPGSSLAKNTFPPLHAAYAGVDGGKPAPGRLGALHTNIAQRDAAAFAIFDPIGITQELNSFRNEAFTRIEDYLDKTDSDQVSNQRKLTIHEKIQEVRLAIEHGLIANANDTAALNDRKRRARVEPIFPDDTPAMKTLKMQANNAYTHPSRAQWEAANPQQLEAFDEAYGQDLTNLAEQARAEAKDVWAKKYARRLDVNGMRAFIDKLDDVIADANEVAAARVDDHLKWVTSEHLLRAFDAFDKNDNDSGHAFAGETALCTVGMSGVPKSADQIDAWIKQVTVDRANHYLRGVYSNQEAAESAANEAMPQIQSMAAAAGTLDKMHGPSVLSVCKKLIDTFKKIDSAYDEWTRKPVQQGIHNWGATREAALLAKLAEWTKTVFRSGIGQADVVLGAVVGAISYSQLGNLTQKLGHDEFMLKAQNSTPEKFEPGYKGKPKAALTRLRRAARKATKNSLAIVEQGSLELIEDARHKVREKLILNHQQVLDAHAKMIAGEKVDLYTNNYHQARIGVALAVLESIGLWGKLSQFKNGTRAWTELAGSVLSLGSILCDTVYATVKSMREIKPYAGATGLDTATDILRGRWKLGAGVLSAAAGAAQITLDGMNLLDESFGRKRGFLMAVYSSRAVVALLSTRAGAKAAFSYAGPMLEYASRNAGTVGYLHKARLASWATRAVDLGKTRGLLLLRVARFNAIGLGLTAAEIAYYGYVSFIADDELQTWCEKSTFRIKKSDITVFGVKRSTDHYATETAEIEALENATRSTSNGEAE
jgi:hypothetical protein